MLANKTYWENQGARRSYSRRLRFECLEDRTLLTTYTVMHLSDSSFPFGPPEQPEHTLRSAIIAANIHANSGTPDVIQFASGLSGSVNIVNGPMVIGDHVQILRPAGAVTLNAGTTDQTSAIQFSIISSNTSSSLVSGLRFTGFDAGIRVASAPSSHNITISGSDFVSNDIGVEITTGTNVSLSSGNLFSSNSLYGVYANHIGGTSRITVSGNRFTYNGEAGLRFLNADVPFTISANTIGFATDGSGASNGTGIRIDDSTDGANSSTAEITLPEMATGEFCFQTVNIRRLALT